MAFHSQIITHRHISKCVLRSLSHGGATSKSALTNTTRVQLRAATSRVDEIQRLIRQSVGVIADLSEAKPNVLYEAGYAHALNKPCVHICSTSIEKLPFDVSHGRRRCIIRARHTNWPKLAQRLKAIRD